jgi:integrase
VPRGRSYTPGKRVPGEKNHGVIYTHAGTFEAFINYGNKRYYAGTCKTIEEARDARDERLRELEGGGSAASLRHRRMKFAHFFEAQFIPLTYNTETNPKRDSTLRSTMSRYKTYLLPFFGDRAIVHITFTTISAFMVKLASGKFRAPETVEVLVGEKMRTFRPRRAEIPSPKSQREVLMLLRSTLDAAVRHRHIRENPFPPKSLPRMDSAKWRKRKTLSPNTILKIVDAIPSMKHRTIAAVLAYAGLRIGEALALKWSDVDVRRGYLSVERSADAKTRKVGKPKTTHSVREVPLDPALVSYLRTYRSATWKKADPGDAWMFPSERRRAGDAGDPIIDQRVFAQRYWNVAREKVTSDRITPHTARHLWISKMVTIFPVADVSMWAGHHSPAFTWDRYVRPLERKEKGSPIKRSIYETKGLSR